MKKLHLLSANIRQVVVTAGLVSLITLLAPAAQATVSFLGVAAGDATTTSAVFWTRADGVAALALDISPDSTFTSGVTHIASACTTDSAQDYTCKFQYSSLSPNTLYYYRFVGPASEMSNVGRIKTAPGASTSAAVHFAFSGDNDGLMRPYALATVIPSQNLDFYINLGDVIYETASNLTGGSHVGPALNSPAVTLSSDALNFNGIPRAFIPSGTPFATQAQLFTDYSRKYRENFLPVNSGGQNSLQVLYAGQGNYTTWDNHELGNRKYIDGGAPTGGSVGGATGTNMPTGRGVDARKYTGSNTGGSGNVNDVNDDAVARLLADPSTTDFMNRAIGFQSLENVFLNYQPIADRGTITAPGDPRTDGTKKLYSAQAWGKNAIYINTDSRSYRDIRLKTATAAADDTSSPRADNANRTYFGATQLAWLKQTLLDAQNADIPWKFVSVSDPIDQIGAIGSGLDGGKSAMGGYRAERNGLMKFIADNHIVNVVFLSTDDHTNRINELLYSPAGQTDLQSSYVKVPYTLSIVAGPLGATGPETITNHTFANIKSLADAFVTAQTTVGVEPIGLMGYPGLHNLYREGDATADTAPQAVDFYSPDTFNFTVLDVSANGKNLMVSSVGMNSTAQNAGLEYTSGDARTVFSFEVDAAPTIASVQINDGSAQRSRVKSVTVTLNGVVPAGSIATSSFLLARTEGGSYVATVQSVSYVGRQTVILLGFSGPGVGTDGSLPDGSYTLSVDRTKIPLDIPTQVMVIATFRTLFGDLSGDGVVQDSEVAASAKTLGSKFGDGVYLWYLDFDADGKINSRDHREVARRNSIN